MVLTAVSKTATTTPEATSVRATRGTGSAGTAAGAMVSRHERAPQINQHRGPGAQRDTHKEPLPLALLFWISSASSVWLLLTQCSYSNPYASPAQAKSSKGAECITGYFKVQV